MQVDKVAAGAHDEEHVDNCHGGGAGAIKDGRGDESAGRLCNLAGEEDDGKEGEDAVPWHLRHRADNAEEAKRDRPEERQLGDHVRPSSAPVAFWGGVSLPMRLISHLSSVPECAITAARTSSPSCSISAAVALP